MRLVTRARAALAAPLFIVVACSGAGPSDTSPDAHVHAADAHAGDTHADDAAHPGDATHGGPEGGRHDATDGGRPHEDASDELGDAGVYTGPERLSETGLYSDLARRTLADGVFGYRVQFELWADGAAKERYLWLPPGTTIDAADVERWRFPVGTRSWKEFIVGGELIETRLLEKTDTGWRMASYLWAEDGSEAWATPAGVRDARATTHDVPSSEDCRKCHRGSADGLIGVSAMQLGAAGVDALVTRGVLAPQPVHAYAPPGPPAVRDALGYLHGNCGYCHNDIHPLSRLETLRLMLTVTATRPEDAPVYRTAIGARSRHDVAGTEVNLVPGAPAESQLLARMRATIAEDRMPPLGTELHDDDAVALIEAWIAAMPRRAR